MSKTSQTHAGPKRATRLISAFLAALMVAGLFATAQAAPAGAAVGGAFTKTKPMANARYEHVAVRLAGGKVLVAGGYADNGKSTEIYTPATKSWSAAANMKDSRSQFAATVLTDGRVLVTGGYNGGTLATAEIYNPTNNTWSRTGSMAYARYAHTSNLLSNGKVLVTGGYGDAPWSSEVFDPATGTFGSLASMNYYRAEHVAARLPGGKVLVAGNDYYSGTSNTRTAEVYNPGTNSWDVVGQLGVGRRYGAVATELSGGSVLITGGRTPDYGTTSAAEIFNPSTNTFSFSGDMNVARYEHDATKLSDGRVLVTGGRDSDGSAEIFDPASGSFDFTGSLINDRWDHTATLLSGSKVLVAGGYNYDDGYLSSAEVFDAAGSAIQDDKADPKVAWSGSVSLVVWQDGRNGNPDIYAARVNASGTVLDPGGIAISTAAGEQTQPTVAWNGTDFLVAWTDRRSGTSTDIYSTKVSSTGVVASTNGKAVSTASNDQSFPIARANTNGQWLVVWQDGRSGTSTDVYGTRVTTAGAVSSPSGQAISTAVRDQRRPSLASNGADWLVVWGDRRASNGNSNIYSTKVTSAGTVSSPNGVAVSSAAGDQSNPSVAWNGTTFMVVWSDYRSGSTLDVYGSRVNANGTTLNASGIAISKQAGATEASPALTAIGTIFMVTWQDDRNGTFDIYSSRVNDTGSVLSPSGVKVNSAAMDQSMPAVGVNGSQFLVVWGDTRSGTNSDIYGTKVATSGAVQNTTGFAIAT